MKWTGIILAMLLCTVACSEKIMQNGSSQDEETRTVMLRATSKSAEGAQTLSETDGTPVFLFWIDGDQTRFGTESVQPYFAAYPQGKADDYADTPYNTGYPYPGALKLHACGYAPSELIADKGDGILPWTILTVPTSLLGSADITSTAGFETGSASAPFEKNDANTLVFNHLQSKVNFYARLGDIPAERYFRAVKITVNGSGRFTEKITWDTDSDAYRATAMVAADVLWSATDPNTNQMDPNEIDPRSIGSVYLHPGQDSIEFLIELEMSETVTFDSSQTISYRAVVPFTADDNVTPITLNAGDEYDINIKILYDSFVIKGNKALWQDGGKIPLPFYPD